MSREFAPIAIFDALIKDVDLQKTKKSESLKLSLLTIHDYKAPISIMPISLDFSGGI